MWILSLNAKAMENSSSPVEQSTDPSLVAEFNWALNPDHLFVRWAPYNWGIKISGACLPYATQFFRFEDGGSGHDLTQYKPKHIDHGLFFPIGSNYKSPITNKTNNTTSKHQTSSKITGNITHML